MGVHTLTKLQYSEDHRGPWQLYVYSPSGRGYEVKTWFAKQVKFPGEEITFDAAEQIMQTAMKEKQEIRICDGGDMLVFHALNGEVLYGKDFWESAESRF